MTLEKREHVRPPVTVHPDGVLAGHTFLMRRIPAQTYINLRRREIKDADLMEATLAAIVDSTLPDGTDLDAAEASALMEAWVKAVLEDAVPPESGTSSP